jgi:hypothetical protein
MLEAAVSPKVKVRLECLGKLKKILMASSGMEPANFLLQIPLIVEPDGSALLILKPGISHCPGLLQYNSYSRNKYNDIASSAAFDVIFGSAL